ncbi:putative endolysin [Escherichia phage SRT8]|uniref:Lysozyme n=1 Tax=Escherichia phage SRT8 TaxID=2496545 RepID=A0A2D1GPB4_9CAUD|nr:endolysin [Escherichia phage SRT8]ATN93850.1 putative endolysin [Escherichia phage SRT8]
MSAIKNTVAATVISAALVLVPGLLEEIEGIRYKPYKDIAGIWTVCSGITGKDVILGKTYTKKECDALLYKHIEVAKRHVDSAVKVPIPDTMRAALYSFTFNVGGGAFRKSTLLKDVNAGRFTKACSRLYDWVYFYNPKTGKMEKSRGLKNRRDIEYKFCMKELTK